MIDAVAIKRLGGHRPRRAVEIRNPKSEIRKKSEIRNPKNVASNRFEVKRLLQERGRSPSDFGFRISACLLMGDTYTPDFAP